MSKKSSPPPLLPLRGLVILLSASFGGTIIGLLTYLVENSPAAAILAGLGTAGATVAFLHRHIG